MSKENQASAMTDEQLPPLPNCALQFCTVYGSKPSNYFTERQMRDYARAALATPAQQTGCSRSHPHENMNEDCQRKTVEAREANAKAQQTEADFQELNKLQNGWEKEAIAGLLRGSDLMESQQTEAPKDGSEKDAERYKYLRTLNVPQFAELFKSNLAGAFRYDDLVDAAIAKEKAK